MTSNDNFEFVVLKKTFTFATCASCDGTGVRKRTFRKMTFVEDCPACHGEGRKRFCHTSEVSLKEALLVLEEEKKNIPAVVQVEEIKKGKKRIHKTETV